MKFDNLRAFEKHLEGAAPKNFSEIYFIIAKEQFDRKTALEKLMAQMRAGKSEQELPLKVYDAEKLPVGEVIPELNTLSFFSAKCVVLITNGEKLTKPSMAKFEAYFEHPNRMSCLIISASAINHATNFYKKGLKAGVTLELPEEKAWDKEKSLTEWIRLQISAAGKAISPTAIQLIQKQTGTDQGLIQGEIEKLLCYVGDRKEVTVQDIGAICASVNIENAWQLGDAIFRRDAPAALRISKALLDDGVAFLALIRQIRTQFQVKFQICSLLTRGGTHADVSQQYPYMKGQILDRNIQMATSYGMERFKKAMLKIDQTEVQAKNSQADDGLLTELLIVSLT